MDISKSALAYQERKGLRPTRRVPSMTLGLDDNLGHSVKLEPPLPWPQLQEYLNGTPPSDAPRIGLWPFGEVKVV